MKNKDLLLSLVLLPMMALALSGCNNSRDNDDEKDFADVGEMRIDRPEPKLAKKTVSPVRKLMTAKSAPSVAIQRAGEMDLE